MYGEEDEDAAAEAGGDDGACDMLESDPEPAGRRRRGHTFEELAQQVQARSMLLYCMRFCTHHAQ